MAVNVQIDPTNTGTFSRVLAGTSPGEMSGAYFGSGAAGQDQFFAFRFNTITSGVAVLTFLNGTSAAGIDSRVLDNNVIVFTATPAQLGITAATIFKWKVQTCPGFDPRVCQANVTSAALGYPSPDTLALLRHASAASFMSRLRIPTLLMQGEGDSLFTIAEAVANYQGIKANGAPVKLVLQSWGHSQSTPAPGEFDQANPPSSYEGRLIMAWFDRYLKDLPVSTGPEVEYFRDWVTYDPKATAAPAYGSAPARS